MKKTMIIAVCLLIFCLTKAQYTITAVNPPKLLQGDTMTVSFVYSHTPSINQINLSTLPAGTGSAQAWEVYPDSFHLLPKTLTGNDTIYKIKKIIPLWFPSGKALVSNDWKHGIEITIGTLTGLSETNSGQDNTLVKYFDLQGNRIEKRNAEVLLEQMGSKRKKIFIVE